MTLPPERIGDRGERYEVRFRLPENDADGRVLCSTDDVELAEIMARVWGQHSSRLKVWIVDRHAKPVNEATDPANTQPTPPVACPTSAGSDA